MTSKLAEIIATVASSGALSEADVFVLREIESDLGHLVVLGFATAFDAVAEIKRLTREAEAERQRWIDRIERVSTGDSGA